MRRTILGLAFAMTSTLAHAELRPFPKTPDENYAVGQLFAQCSARLALVSEVADGAGLKNSALAASDAARGWKFAGMIFLAEGLDVSRQPHTEPLFDDLVSSKITQLRALREIRGSKANDDVLADFEKECQPWADTQKALIEMMRRSPLPAN